MSIRQESASKWLNNKLTGVRGQYASATLFTLLSAGCFVAFSWFLSEFAASWLDNGIIVYEKILIASFFLTGRYIFAHLETRFNYNAGNSIVDEIKKELLPILLHNSKLNSTDSALYITKISDDIKPYFAFFVPYSVATVVVSIFLLLICFFIEKWVALILMISLLVIPIQMAVIGIGAETIHKKHTQLFIKYSAIFYNRLKTIAEIINLDNFKTQYHFLSRKGDELNEATINIMGVAILSSAILELFVTIAIAAVAIYLGMSLMGIMNGPNYGKGYNFGTALFLLAITPYFFFYIRKFVSAYHDRNKALAAAELLMPLTKHHNKMRSVNLEETYFSLEVNKLNFSYPNSPVKVLNNIHKKFPKKGLVLVKGISGSGKSTFLKICAGSLSVNDGYISVNKKDNSWSELWLKENTSYMNQFPFIFDGSLRYNVFLKKEIEESNDYPSFLNRILEKKENGWNTNLTHNGIQLSGGERQLVTLARMMLHQKQIAILDEPTASLDSETTAVIISEVVNMAKKRLVIIASHERRFELVADNIVNLNWGEQIEYA